MAMKFSKEQIFKGPIGFKECHASSILPLKEGAFLATWFAGTKEGKNDVAIWIAKRDNEGWHHPQTIAKIQYVPHWNPVLFRAPNDTIQLYFKVGKKISNWVTWVMKSTNEGLDWSQPEELVPGDTSGGRGPVKNKPITLTDGTIAAPASVELDKWEAFVDLSSDNGKSWTRSEFVPMENLTVDDKQGNNRLALIQPTLWESSPGNVHMLLRSNNSAIYRSDSIDNGRTWSQAYPIDLPNNNSGIDMVKLANGTLALVYNDNAENWGNRCKLNLAYSHDNGHSWPEKHALEHSLTEKVDDIKIEYSYPAIIAIGNHIAVTYTVNRKNIVFVTDIENTGETSEQKQ